MSEIVDITDGLPVEQTPPTPEAPAPEPEQPESQEFVPYRYKDTEAQIPADAAAAVAAALGYDNPAALVNKLRMADEADEIYRDARRMYRASRAPQAPPQQPDAYYQEQEARRTQPRQPQYQAPPQDDPLEMLRAVHAKMQEVDQRTQAFSSYVEQQQQRDAWDRQQREQQFIQEAHTEYQKFVGDLKKNGVPAHKIPEQEYLLEEAEAMGMFGGRLPVGDIYRRTYKMVYGDDIAQEAVRHQMARLRDPKARVAVPSAPASQPTPQAPNPNTIAGMEQALGGLRFSEIDLPHERR